MTVDTITIDSCPLCSLRHEYTVVISTRLVMGLVAAFSAPAEERQVRVAAACPEKNDRFVVTMTVEERADAPIEKVSLILLAPPAKT